ncbi:fungal-specific transcription factor domain-containing protein [Gongronella butleri]|nr:fungal-specific transcription factor domain-containing protein [Gongronella butleri]
MKSPPRQHGHPIRPLNILPGRTAASPAITSPPSPQRALSFKRPRISHACDNCRRRKVRCDMFADDRECNQCIRSRAQCTFSNSNRRRGPRGSVAILEERLQRMEQLLHEVRHGQPASAPAPEDDLTQPQTQHKEDETRQNGSQHTNLNASRHFGIAHWIYCAFGMDKRTSDELVKFYFANVYPMFPVLDKREFLQQYYDVTNSYPDPALFYCIYGSALHFMDCVAAFKVRPPTQIAIDGSIGSSETWFDRHSSYVRKVASPNFAVIQSIVMSMLYHSSLEKKWSNVWLLNSVGVRMAQDIGLHRLCHRTRCVSDDQCEVRSRIWGFLYTLDRWFSAGTGRPCTTFDEDCEQIYTNEMANMRQLHQSMQEYPCSPTPMPKIPIFQALAQIMNLSKILGNVIQYLYTPAGKKHCETHGGAASVATLEGALYEWRMQLPPLIQNFGVNEDLDNTSIITAHVVGVCYYSVLILVHRPFIDKWCHISLRICTTAAIRCVDLMTRLHEMDTLIVHWSFLLYPLFVASLIHVYNAGSPDSAIADVAKANLVRALTMLQTYGNLSPLADYLHKVLHCVAEKQKHLPTYGISASFSISSEDSAVILDWLHSIQDTLSSVNNKGKCATENGRSTTQNDAL